MKRNLAIIFTYIIVFTFGLNPVWAQLKLKIPKIKVEKTDQDQLKTKDTTTTGKVNSKTYYRIIRPVKIIGTNKKWDAAAWKTAAFDGNPLTGFAVQ